ncbi:Threonine-phosphate decarboxylase [Shimia thalassica]|uniref:Aminotransferase n=1 Tax=Shimia thalassica TaxID=1715693 RepID=A0A0P1I8R5_9RHOB|nr:threonine-phosphate decarboxylase [Shimia thalassica]CUJ82787.1 Threonine-phosphate decarboxylase [Shimia thalassica]
MTLVETKTPRDHGGGLDAAMARWGGDRSDWIDLSTGINPVPYPVTALPEHAWTALPDKAAQAALLDAARRFWRVPEQAAILAAPGASALIARIPALATAAGVDIPEPTYNEHAAAFLAQGWQRTQEEATARVLVHPNNPTGQIWTANDLTAPLTIVDESFCDIAPDQSLIAHSADPGRIVLKSFGKFWGLAGMRLGFAIGNPALIERLNDLSGPWAVSCPALHIGALALQDPQWADETRNRLQQDSERLDRLMLSKGADLAGGTPLFRLYKVSDAKVWQERLASKHIWSRIFPYSETFLRLGLPAPDRWDQLEAAL